MLEATSDPDVFRINLHTTGDGGMATVLGNMREVSIKVISEVQGSPYIGFTSEWMGSGTAPAALEVAAGRTSYYDVNEAISFSDTGAKRRSVTFSSPRAATIELTGPTTSPFTTDADGLRHYSGKYGNGVDSYSITATVLTANKIPVVGQEVNWSIVSGTGATLSATRSTTNNSGKASVSVYSTRQGDVKVRGRTYAGATTATADIVVNFASTGIVSIKAESDNEQKVAREYGADKAKIFDISAYDVNLSRVDFTNMGIPKADWDDVTNTTPMYIGAKDTATKLELYAEVGPKPPGASLVAANIYYGIDEWTGPSAPY